ncbi:MAG TPA: NrfD/PsrC family molybdoenzyme membrane anchor subunit [Candidatus Dormibacteraeota bacterium]|nr:NrfD/PsrC family molybdoenzyme membrane anchor subunit [Candidatus Dormibacteraeota bacterium]
MILLAEHFVRAPQWLWYILFYFFFAGLAGGSYAIGTLLRLSGDVRDEAAARVGFLIAGPTTAICPILLTADLGVSWSRFWHMLVDVTPGSTGLNFHYWSPMSVGVWALTIFGFFVLVSFLDAWRPFIPRPVNIVFNVVGAVIAIYVASYTGVLLSVSNQPVWSDTWALGGLFLASGLSGSAALIALLIRNRADAAFSLSRLHQADGYFSALELVLVIVFFVTIGAAGVLDREIVWLPLWAIAVAGIAASLVEARGHMRARVSGSGTVAGMRIDTLVVSVLVLLGVLALRAAVIFSAQ